MHWIKKLFGFRRAEPKAPVIESIPEETGHEAFAPFALDLPQGFTDVATPAEPTAPAAVPETSVHPENVLDNEAFAGVANEIARLTPQYEAGKIGEFFTAIGQRFVEIWNSEYLA